ncbi:MAG: TonB-dependent receptor domain-containing protein, partial [Pyrinomonadaceae bacterium]
MMTNLRHFLGQSFSLLLLLVLSAVITSAQQARGTSLRGLITDELGAVIVGASVVLNDANGVQKAATTTNGEGVYIFSGVQPGKYLVHASAPGFAASDDTEVDLAAGQRQTQDLTLKVTIEEKVTVAAETPLSTEATNNANQTLISGRDLDALPDDPDELAAALQALAGPSVGPNGGQIFIDGFSGGRLPPKESIREIRINQNPFAAENDQPSGRVDILTRPGTDKFRGGSYFTFEDESLNSRNPFSDSRTPYQVRSFGGNFGGPLVKKKASFFIDFDRREIDDNELVNVTTLDANLNPVEQGFGVVTPRRNLGFGPRVDYQINTNNTLIVRYEYNRNNRINNGVSGFSLPERAYDSVSSNQSISITETAVLNAAMVNETRFRYSRNRNESFGNNTIPTLDVSGAFISGGSQVGHALNNNNSWELQNFLAWQKGSHAIKFGGRVRGVNITDINPNNFGGTYRFTGGFVPALDANNNPIFDTPVFVDSIERYRRNQLFSSQPNPLSAAEIQRRGGGASQFSIAGGNPEAGVTQRDVGVYVQDDWRVRPNLTLSFGLRYENQTNIHSPTNFAPRVAFAWSPGAANSTRPPNMVIRAGAGVFYNRFNEGSTLQANRFNGVNQQQFSVSESLLYVCRRNPGVDPNAQCVDGQNGQLVYVDPALLPPSPLLAFPNLPPTVSFTPNRQITWRVAEDLQTPTVYLGGIQVERQLPHRFTATVGFYTVHIQHVIRA